jgi:hypothetical protein
VINFPLDVLAGLKSPTGSFQHQPDYLDHNNVGTITPASPNFGFLKGLDPALVKQAAMTER